LRPQLETLDFIITHKPGHMFITNVPDAEVAVP